MDEPILNYVTRRLHEYKGNWPQISKDTGVGYDTITKIAQGVRDNPTIDSLQPLIDWFAARDEMLAKLDKKTAAV